MHSRIKIARSALTKEIRKQFTGIKRKKYVKGVQSHIVLDQSRVKEIHLGAKNTLQENLPVSKLRLWNLKQLFAEKITDSPF